MKTGYGCRLVLAATLALWLVQAAAGEWLVLYTQRPPLMGVQKGQFVGPLGQRVGLALELAGMSYRLQEASVERQAVIMARTDQAVCAAGRVRIADRLGGQYSNVLYTSAAYVALARKDSSLGGAHSLQSLSQNGVLRWGVHTGLLYSQYVSGLLLTSKSSVQRFDGGHLEGARKLAAGSFDFMLLHRDEARYILDALGPAAKGLVVVDLSDLAVPESRHFYCNSKFTAGQMDHLNAAIARLPPQALP